MPSQNACHSGPAAKAPNSTIGPMCSTFHQAAADRLAAAQAHGIAQMLLLSAGADLIEGPKPTFRDGRMKMPDGAGVGVLLDPDKLA